MKYAVIRVDSKQYKVEEGEEILVDKIKDKKTFSPDVLLFVDGEKTKIGTPVLKDIKLKLKVSEDDEKGKKLYVSKYKAKSRYRKKIGFRPVYTRVTIEKIV